MASTFTRMDESTAEQWAVIGTETLNNQPRVAEQVLTMLRQLEGITDGFATNQLVHSLQTATLAEQAGADHEVVFASLCHDIGKVVSVFSHPDIAAEMIRPYVRDDVYQMIRATRTSRAGTTTPTSVATRTARAVPRRALVRARRAVRRRVGPDRVRPRRRDLPARALRAARLRDDRHPPSTPEPNMHPAPEAGGGWCIPNARAHASRTASSS